MPTLVPTGDLIAFLKDNALSLRRIGNEIFPVILTPETLETIPLDDVLALPRPPVNKQIPLMKAGRWALQEGRPLIICVQQGGGKTFITLGAAVSEVKKARAEGRVCRIVIIAPAHLMHNWYREIQMVLPDAKILIAHRAGDLMPASQVAGLSYVPIPKRRKQGKNAPVLINPYPNASLAEAEFILVNYTGISLSAKIRPAAAQGFLKETITKYVNGRSCTVKAISLDTHTRQATPVAVCPDCGAVIMGRKDSPITLALLEDKRLSCREIKYRRVQDKEGSEYGTYWKPGVKERYHTEMVKDKRGNLVLCGGRLWQYTADPLPAPHNGTGGTFIPGAKLQQFGEMRQNASRPPAWDREIWGSDGRIIAHRSPSAKRQIREPLRPLGSTPYKLATPTDLPKTYKPSGSRKMDLATIFKKRYPYPLDLAVIDEGHLAKSGESARGMATANIGALARVQFMLTGTLSGGYASTLFYLLWRFSRAVRKDFSYHEVSRWVEQYGVRQMTYRTTKDEPFQKSTTGKMSKQKNRPPSVREIPGLSSEAMKYILPDTVFGSLDEIFPYPLIPNYSDSTPAVDLDYSQITPMEYWTTDKDGELVPHTIAATQGDLYKLITDTLRAECNKLLMRNDRGLLAIMLQTLLRWPNACTLPIEIQHPRTNEIVLRVPGLPEEWIFPKEQWLLELCHRWKQEGHRAIVYVAHVGDIDVGARLKDILEREYQGQTLKVAFLRSTTVDTEDREDWIKQQVEDGADILLCNPQLVETGLNLIQFSRVAMYEMIYSAYTLAQCVRRVLRPGQKHDVEVYYPQYRGAFEIGATQLMALKMRSAAQVTGQLEDVLMQQGGEPDLQGFLVKYIKGTLNLNQGTEGIQAAFDAAHQQTDANRQAAFEEFRRLYKLSPEAEELLDHLTEENDPLANIELDFDLIAEMMAKLSDEEFEALLYPFGK